jgi:hypothetical protein
METRAAQSNTEKRSLAKSDDKGSKSRNSPRPMATIENDDERLLARIGYRQVREQIDRFIAASKT